MTVPGEQVDDGVPLPQLPEPVAPPLDEPGEPPLPLEPPLEETGVPPLPCCGAEEGLAAQAPSRTVVRIRPPRRPAPGGDERGRSLRINPSLRPRGRKREWPAACADGLFFCVDQGPDVGYHHMVAATANRLGSAFGSHWFG